MWLLHRSTSAARTVAAANAAAARAARRAAAVPSHQRALACAASAATSAAASSWPATSCPKYHTAAAGYSTAQTRAHNTARRHFSSASAASADASDNSSAAETERAVGTTLPPECLLSEAERSELVARGGPASIRNFSIIAHIDHGKSTLADRLLESAGNIRALGKEDAQVLDNLQVERERGITVKAQTASIFYRDTRTGKSYILNLIDTPGHVDFSYEVSRSLAACQGALLLIDSSQGVQAQTIANYYTAMDANLDIIPVLSKIDLPHSDIKGTGEQIQVAFDMDPASALAISSKTGQGIDAVFRAIIDRIQPPPTKVKPGVDPCSIPLRALVFDSWFDIHRGVICLVKIVDGAMRKSDKIQAWYGEQVYDVQEIGLTMGKGLREVDALTTGQVGYMIAGIKTSKEIRLGETFFKIGTRKGTRHQQTATINAAGGQDNLATAHLAPAGKASIEPLPGFKPARSMVFAGLFPSSGDFEELSTALEKLLLNDASVHVEKESSQALGLGYRCGFLGVLHMDVFSSRLEQDFGAPVIITAPTVPYVAVMHSQNGQPAEHRRIDSPAKFPDGGAGVDYYLEPMVKATIIAPSSYLGDLVDLCNSHRGVMEEMVHLTPTRISLRYKLPLSEIVIDFYDRIKTISSGYASFDYEEMPEMEQADICKLELRLNGEPVDALCVICDRSKAEPLARKLTAKLKDKIDRQNFEVIIQAAIGNKILARERIAPFRKDVLIKSGKTVGGGDQTRKKKLLEKQKAGKKRLKAVGNVELNEEVFTSVMKLSDK